MTSWCHGWMIISALFLITITIHTIDAQTCVVPGFPPFLLSATIECLPPGLVEVGSNCTYFCDDGYVLVGNEIVPCLEPNQTLVLPVCDAFPVGTGVFPSTEPVTLSEDTGVPTPPMPGTPSATVDPSTVPTLLDGTSVPITEIATSTTEIVTDTVTNFDATSLMTTLSPTTAPMSDNTGSTTGDVISLSITSVGTEIPTTATESGTTESATDGITSLAITSMETGIPTSEIATGSTASTTESVTNFDGTSITTVSQTTATLSGATDVSTLPEDTPMTTESRSSASPTSVGTTEAATNIDGTSTNSKSSTTATLTSSPGFGTSILYGSTESSSTTASASRPITDSIGVTDQATLPTGTSGMSTADMPEFSTSPVLTTGNSILPIGATDSSSTSVSTVGKTTSEVRRTSGSPTTAGIQELNCTLTEVSLPLTPSFPFEYCAPGDSIGLGSTCSFECPFSYLLIGNADVTCMRNGVLSEIPYCEAVRTYIVIATFLDKTFNTSLLDRTSSYYVETADEIATFVQMQLNTTIQPGLFEIRRVKVNGFSPGSVVADLSVYVPIECSCSLQDEDISSMIHSSMIDIAQGNPTYIDAASIQTLSTVTCTGGIIMTQYGPAMFENTAINVRAYSIDSYCPYYTENGGEALEATCVGDFIRPCDWVVPEMSCGGNLTTETILENFKSETVTRDNVERVAEDVADLTSSNRNVSQMGLEVMVGLLEDITAVNATDPEVTESVVEIADNIAGFPEELLQESNATDRVVLALEAQLNVVEVENGSSRFLETNIAAEVLEVTTDDFHQGYTVLVSESGDEDDISEEDFKVKVGDRTQEAEATEAQATLYIPPRLADRFINRRGRLIITTYRVPSLFQDERLADFNGMTEEFNRTVNSRIISASVNNEKVEDLRDPVRISFIPVNPNGTNAQCVFWVFEERGWSFRGCNKTGNSTERINCECNHLTNFGLLLDIHGSKTLTDEEDFILQIISYVGCLMSVWGLVMTIITYASNKKLRDRKPNQILLSLSCSLLALYVTFLTLMSLDVKQGTPELQPVPCAILAAFVQYFALSSIFWMGVEGYNMYNFFVLVLNTYKPRFMRKVSLFAWGLPLVIVGITAAASRQYYAISDMCFLDLWPLIGGLLIPVSIVMIFNLVIFVRILMEINKTIKGRHIDKPEKRKRLRRFQNALCIMTLMGLTWSIGYLSIFEPSSPLIQGTFTVLNSLQGYFIFMLYCVRQPQVRIVWRSQFRCCLPDSFTTPSAVKSSSGQTNSTHKSSSDRQRVNEGNTRARLFGSDSSGFRPETVMTSPPERIPRPRLAYDNVAAERM